MSSEGNDIVRLDRPTRDQFYGDFVSQGRPVVIKGLTDEWRALNWNPSRFRGPEYVRSLPVKIGNVADGKRKNMALADYMQSLQDFDAGTSKVERPDSPGYMHDVPLFHVFPSLQTDVAPFPLKLLPKWYWQNWPGYAQHFIGPGGSQTPLHFDTLLTHNLFFHLAGRKRFILIPPDQLDLCYRDGWRWARFDPSSPDYKQFPRAAEAAQTEVRLEPGDILYLPPGTLHHVTNLTTSISFNIDWHTASSALRGVASVARGAPIANGYYNLLCFLGVGLRVPSQLLFPLYRPYLSYVT